MPAPDYRWRIYQVRAKATTIGYVEAPDEQRAIETAIRLFDISTSKQRSFLSLSVNLEVLRGNL